VTHVSAVKHVLHTGMHAVQVGEVLKKPVRQAVQITVPFNLQVWHPVGQLMQIGGDTGERYWLVLQPQIETDPLVWMVRLVAQVKQVMTV